MRREKEECRVGGEQEEGGRSKAKSVEGRRERGKADRRRETEEGRMEKGIGRREKEDM